MQSKGIQPIWCYIVIREAVKRFFLVARQLELSGRKRILTTTKNLPKYFRLKEPYLDVILYLGNQRYHTPQ